MRTYVRSVCKIVILSLCLAFLLPGILHFPPEVEAAGKRGTLIGAIRWDGWVGDTNTNGVGAPYVGQQVETALGPNQYHFRLPFYGVETGTNTVQARELTQAVMDQDIAYAKNAGIDYWAFCYYADGSGMDIARNLYFSSTHKNDINYSLILGTSLLLPSNFDWLVSRFQDSNYQKVLNGRPLVYISGGTGGYTADNIQTLRTKSTTAGLSTPYIVLMGASASTVDSLGADAISAYTSFGGGGKPYTHLMAADQNGWNTAKSTGKNVVPWVTTGWDPRPRIDNPVSWHSYGANDWIQTAQPSEIAYNLKKALDWTHGNSTVNNANAILMYAWNEFDEGGWMSPTLFDGTDRLDAIHDVLFPANLALNKTYAASSQQEANQAASKAFDEMTNTNWQAALGSNYNGQWLEVDFGSNTTFDEVMLTEYGGRTSGFRIEYWSGGSWNIAYTGTTIGSVSNPSTHTFAPVTGTKARIYYTSGSGTPIMYEFNIFNTGSYTSVKDWNFNTNGNFEGWTMFYQVSGTVTGGEMTLTTGGTDPQILSADSLGITDPAKYHNIRIGMRNNSSKNLASIFFITNSDTTWNQTKSVSFNIIPNSDYTEYIVDMSASASWAGTIKRLRMDPLDPAESSSATLNVDYIRVTN